MTLFERMAAAQHDIWSHWMKWQFTKGILVRQGDLVEKGSFLINADSVKRWMRQMNTPYAELTETEKDSDRKVVQEFMGFVFSYIGEHVQLPNAEFPLDGGEGASAKKLAHIYNRLRLLPLEMRLSAKAPYDDGEHAWRCEEWAKTIQEAIA